MIVGLLAPRIDRLGALLDSERIANFQGTKANGRVFEEIENQSH